MEPRHLYTIRWTQQYATQHLRPFLRNLQEQLEADIERQLETNDFADAMAVIERIQSL